MGVWVGGVVGLSLGCGCGMGVRMLYYGVSVGLGFVGKKFIVGDDWQSIYGFRNAHVGYIIDLKKHFPSVTTHKLTINYRSRHEIVKISNRFIRKNRFRTRKKLWAFKGRGGAIHTSVVSSLFEEVENITTILRSEIQNARDIAVLYRNNWQGDYIQKKIPEKLKTREKVHFMTMHASKGLEFDVVIIAGIADDIIPDKDTNIEEERRLLYVALTRAERKLYIIARKEDNEELPVFARELGVRFIKNQ